MCNSADPTQQKTICILESPWRIQIRTYKNRVESVQTRVNYAVEDLNTALIRLNSETILLTAAGWQSLGLSNAQSNPVLPKPAVSNVKPVANSVQMKALSKVVKASKLILSKKSKIAKPIKKVLIKKSTGATPKLVKKD